MELVSQFTEDAIAKEDRVCGRPAVVVPAARAIERQRYQASGTPHGSPYRRLKLLGKEPARS